MSSDNHAWTTTWPLCPRVRNCLLTPLARMGRSQMRMRGRSLNARRATKRLTLNAKLCYLSFSYSIIIIITNNTVYKKIIISNLKSCIFAIRLLKHFVYKIMTQTLFKLMCWLCKYHLELNEKIWHHSRKKSRWMQFNISNVWKSVLCLCMILFLLLLIIIFSSTFLSRLLFFPFPWFFTP